MMKALSIRQPWAWLIVNGYKDVENRKWQTAFRGPVLIHASKTMTRADYEDCALFVGGIWRELEERGFDFNLPEYEDLIHEGGGIVGQAEIVGCVTESISPWFCGPYGFGLVAAQPLPFRPCRGMLKFFEVNS